jgi:hypothetical protein
MTIFKKYIVIDTDANQVVSDHDNAEDATWSVNVNNELTNSTTRFVIYKVFAADYLNKKIQGN